MAIQPLVICFDTFYNKNELKFTRARLLLLVLFILGFAVSGCFPTHIQISLLYKFASWTIKGMSIHDVGFYFINSLRHKGQNK